MIIHNWKKVLFRSWSMWAMAAAALNGLAMCWFVFADRLPLYWFATGAVLIPLVAMAMRLLSQPELHNDK